ncbi:MAG: hypothetical protein BV457_04080 [Thermoplasmata archaeon M9B1D]|nr:MAG: hypothetical protein BV457_04080 [Thermoplasmata archaeon M9B1D]PNX51067.1 MAG: hypothetical protein BV456_04600 [Thermoplasmata archaeon M8B2D]
MAKLCSRCGKITLLDAYYLPNNVSVCKNCYDEYYNEIDESKYYDNFDTWLDKRLKEINRIW